MVQSSLFFALSVTLTVMMVMVYGTPVDRRFKDNDELNDQFKLKLPDCAKTNSCRIPQNSPSPDTLVVPANCPTPAAQGDMTTSNNGGTQGNGARGTTTKETTLQGGIA